MEKERPAKQKSEKKNQGASPGLILLIAAIIIFGLMIGFLYFENLNPDWLRTST